MAVCMLQGLGLLCRRILEVTLSGLQRTAGWLRWSLANALLFTLEGPGSKEWGREGKSGLGLVEGKEFQKVAITPTSASRATPHSDPSSFHLRGGQNSPLNLLCPQISTSPNLGAGNLVVKEQVAGIFSFADHTLSAAFVTLMLQQPQTMCKRMSEALFQ